MLSKIKWRVSDGTEFKRIRVLGSGISGSVQLVETFDMKGNKQLYALKSFKECKKELIEREALLLSAISSSFVVSLIDTVTIGPFYFLVMEYSPQAPIDIYWDLTLVDIRWFIYQLLCGLDTCHRQGIVHADIKPGNIAINMKQKRLKLLDFGHSFRYREQHGIPCYIGTIAYKPPEILFHSTDYSFPVDVWAAGRVFFDMLMPYQMNSFIAKDNASQVLLLSRFLGSESLLTLCRKYQLQAFKLPAKQKPRTIQELVILNAQKAPIHHRPFHMERYNSHFTPLNMDLLNRMLMTDPAERWTVKQCLQHPFFSAVRHSFDEEPSAGRSRKTPPLSLHSVTADSR